MIYIENFAFNNFISLEKITIPPSIRIIPKNSFKRCSNLKEITIDPYKTEFEENTFFRNIQSVEKIFIPNSIKSIGKQSFSGCSSLQLVSIPSSLLSIKNSTIDGCFSRIKRVDN